MNNLPEDKTPIIYHDKESGQTLVYREMTDEEMKAHPKYDLVKKICDESWIFKED